MLPDTKKVRGATMMRYWNSPAVQEEIRLLNSPAVREMITIANNLEIQAKTNSNISIPVREDTLTSLHEATPLIPKESREKFNEITTVEPEASRKLLSAQNIEWAVKTLVAAILSAFLSAFFTFLFQQLPDKNTEEQMELLREPSEIREKIVESLDIDSEELFKDIVKYLDDNGLVIAQSSESICDRSDGIPNRTDVVNEEVDAISDLIVSEGQDNDAADQSIDQNLKP